MSMLLLFVLLLGSLIAVFLRKMCAVKSLLCITLIIFLGVGTGLLPSCCLNSLQIFKFSPKTEFGNKTAIVLLGLGGVKLSDSNTYTPMVLSHSRIDAAAILYHACKDKNKECRIIISGGDPRKIDRSEAEVYQDTLVQLKVNKNDIILESKSNNTFENARLTNEIIKTQSFDTVYLVTSGFHMKRSQLYFSHFGLTPIPYPSDYLEPMITWIPIAYNFTVTDIAIHEYLGILRYKLYNFFNLNEAKVLNETKVNTLHHEN